MLSLDIRSKFVVLFSFFSILTFGCVEKNTDPSDPSAAFAEAREPYDDEMYEVAIQKLGEFKSRFPYSKHAPEAELLIADALFQLTRYTESASAYDQFLKLHPSHQNAAFARYRVGEAYWAEAPDDIDREQDFTLRAIAEWEKLSVDYPQSEQMKQASELLKKGYRRVAEHDQFIANFYCKKEIYHACAYRYLQLADKHRQFPDLVKTAYSKAAIAFEAMAIAKSKDEQSDSNIYFKTMSSEQLRAKASELKAEASKDKL